MRRVIGLIIINGVFITVMAILAPVFVSWANLSALLANMALESIAMAGVTLLLIARLFDLSVDGVVAMVGVLTGQLMIIGLHPVIAVLIGFSAGAIAGLVNGLLIMRLKINPLIATLGVWWICSGIAFGMTRAISPFGFPDGFQILGQARIFGLRIFIFYAAIIVGLLTITLAYTKIGRHVYIMGGNPEAGHLFGVPVKQLGVKLYVLMGLLSAFIGIVMAARLNAAAPNVVDGMTMRVIAATVIGGCALSGGKGNILAGLLGLLLLNMLTNAATILGISPYWQKSLIGTVLLLALILDISNGGVQLPSWVNRRFRNA